MTALKGKAHTMTDSTTETAGPEERMINKVMRLLAKAESTTPEEAEALVAKAAELMARHALEAQGAIIRDEERPMQFAINDLATT